jgi:hypothetical protein
MQMDAWLDYRMRTSMESCDLTSFGLEQHTWASAIVLLLANHLGTETDEITALEGIHGGARGYPICL